MSRPILLVLTAVVAVTLPQPVGGEGRAASEAGGEAKGKAEHEGKTEGHEDKAEAEPVDDPDLSAPRSAAVAFASALDRGDAGAAEAAATGGEAEMKLLAAMARMTRSHRRLAEAAADKFGEAGKALGGSYADPGLEDMATRARLTEEGDVALLRLEEGVIFLKVSRADGEWRVDLAGSIEAGAAEEQVPLLEAAARAADRTARGIESGEYQTLEEAEAALKEHGHPEEERAGEDKPEPA